MVGSVDPFDVFSQPSKLVPDLKKVPEDKLRKLDIPGVSPLPVDSSNELSDLTCHLQSLQKRVPVVSDKALIDLVNGIEVSAETIRFRKSRGFLGRLIDQFNGSERQRNLLVEGNLISGQATLHQWTLELSNSLTISRVGLEITQRSLQVTQKSLLEARNAIRNQKKDIDELRKIIRNLSLSLEENIRQLEVRMSAQEDFERIVKAWIAGRTYKDLPWVVQVALLTQEVFSSSIPVYELQSGDTHYRQRLVDELNAEIRHRSIPKRFDGFGNLLDSSWLQIREEEDKYLSANLLDTRSIQFNQVTNIPIIFTMGSAFELFMLSESVRPKSPGQCAVELCRNQIMDVPPIRTPQEYVEAIVEETANYYFSVISLSNNLSA